MKHLKLFIHTTISLTVHLIVDMSEVFLKDFKFGDNNLNIVSELQKYKVEADKLRASAKVKHLNEALEAIYEGHIPDVSNMPTILIKLHNPWHASSINGLSLLIHNLLPVRIAAIFNEVHYH